MVKKGRFKKALITSAAVLGILAAFTMSAFAAGRMLVPMGCTVGISLDSMGVIVAGYSQAQSSPAKEAGILPGDVIIRVGDRNITCAEDIRGCDLGTGELSITVSRNGEEKTFTVKPAVNPDGTGELGLWLRDSISGIGTVTYYDPATGEFGALGHPVNDIDSGLMIPMRAGQISRATITDIVQGKCGTPGQLVGIFDFNAICGNIQDNTPCGIFGKITDSGFSQNGNAIEAADASDIHTGKAVIISSINNGTPQEYNVEITRVDRGSTDGRCMMLKVTDSQLLSATGGIVQGMSGSPIIQDGKLIGAVTHVLINDPARGYGISIEKMLDAAA